MVVVSTIKNSNVLIHNDIESCTNTVLNDDMKSWFNFIFLVQSNQSSMSANDYNFLQAGRLCYIDNSPKLIYHQTTFWLQNFYLRMLK